MMLYRVLIAMLMLCAICALLLGILGVICLGILLVLKTVDLVGVWLDEHPERKEEKP